MELLIEAIVGLLIGFVVGHVLTVRRDYDKQVDQRLGILESDVLRLEKKVEALRNA